MKKDHNFRVIFTSAGGGLVAQLIKHVRNIQSENYDIKVIAADASGMEIPSFAISDYGYIVPKGNDKNYIPKMLDIVKETSANLIFPWSDEEALAIAKHRDEFEALGCQVACVESEKLEIFSSKAKTYQKLKELGIPVADWKEIESSSNLKLDVNEMIDAFGACIIKPSVSRGGRDVYYIAKDKNIDHSDYQNNPEITFISYDDFLNIDYDLEFKGQYPLVVMQPLYRPVCDLDMLAWEGKPISIVPRRRVHSDYPNAGHKILNDERLIEIGEKIIVGFNLSWIYDCDLMVDKDGNPYPIEINPRMSGSLAISVVAGSGAFESLFNILSGESVSRQPIDHMVGKTLLPANFLVEARS